MEYRYPTWPRMEPSRSEELDRAFLDWTEGTALGGKTSGLVADSSDPAECSCLDKCLAELEDLLRSLDAYNVER